MTAVRTDRRVAVDPVAPGVVSAVPTHSGTGAVAHPVGGGRGAVEQGQGGVAAAAEVGAVESAVDVEGGGQPGRAFGQLVGAAGLGAAGGGQVRAAEDLAGPQQDAAGPAL